MRLQLHLRVKGKLITYSQNEEKTCLNCRLLFLTCVKC